MIAIKHRVTEQTLREFDVETVKDALVKAVSEKANLDGANLRGANLDGEKITKNPLSVSGIRYWCLISDAYMRLGCKRFTHDEWANFTDETIRDMDSGALDFWRQWKAPLLAMCAAHRSTP